MVTQFSDSKHTNIRKYLFGGKNWEAKNGTGAVIKRAGTTLTTARKEQRREKMTGMCRDYGNTKARMISIATEQNFKCQQQDAGVLCCLSLQSRWHISISIQYAQLERRFCYESRDCVPFELGLGTSHLDVRVLSRQPIELAIIIFIWYMKHFATKGVALPSHVMESFEQLNQCETP